MKNGFHKPRILISTGIYPPAIGGPAEYAKNLKEEFQRMGFEVRLKRYGFFEKMLPTGVRHLFYFLKIIPAVAVSNNVIALDTFSVGLPTACAARLLGKRIIIRTGGDFLWEGYVERTGDKVLLRDFYLVTQNKWNLKERIIYRLTKAALHFSSAIVFSTKWQKDIFDDAYGLKQNKRFIIENFYGEIEKKVPVSNRCFLASTRNLKWKNLDVLSLAFNKVKRDLQEVELFTEPLSHEEFIQKMKDSYAAILVSLGDISPNMILDALRTGTPFILTKENGLMDRIGDIGVFADPLNEIDIEEKIKWLLDPVNYEKVRIAISRFNFRHSYKEIAEEFLDIFSSLKK